MGEKKKSGLTPEGRNIIREIEKVKSDLAMNRMYFDLATDESLIESYIYTMLALNKKYQYYLKKAKENGVTAEGFGERGEGN